MKSIKKIIMAIFAFAFVFIVPHTDSIKPLEASASWHWDFWNDYEDNCAVAYQKVATNCYKVVVISDDMKRMWRNDGGVPYWYSSSQLKTMIGENPKERGSKIVDINVDLLNDTDHFIMLRIG